MSVVSRCYIGTAECIKLVFGTAGRVACCPLVSHGEYADETNRQTDGKTDVRQTVTLRFPLGATNIMTLFPSCSIFPVDRLIDTRRLLQSLRLRRQQNCSLRLASRQSTRHRVGKTSAFVPMSSGNIPLRYRSTSFTESS